MKSRHVSSKKNIGLIIVACGALLWLLPFAVVALDNALGTTKPADTLIGSFGLVIIAVGPVLVIAGLLIAVFKKLSK